MRTRLGRSAILGLISLKLLLDILRVLSSCNYKSDSGSESSLLLCKSTTLRLGAFSKLSIASKLLNDIAKVSSFLDLGTAENALN